MDRENREKYFELYEKLNYYCTESYKVDREKIAGTICELCRLFRISRASTEFYRSIEHEKMKRGEELCCYDDGTDYEPVLVVRIVTKVRAVVIATVCMNNQVRPLDEEEKRTVELIMRTILSYYARIRLQDVIETLTYHDDANYHNLRYFFRTLEIYDEQKILGGLVAVHYNLRHFALVNQEVGRNAGDFVMKSHFEGLEKIVGEKGVVCRLGGDNFVALCEKQNLDAVIDYLYETPIVYDVNYGNRVMIHTSAGIYKIPEDFVMDNKDQIFDKIIAASQAARNGKNDRIVIYSDDIDIGKAEANRLQQIFPEALKNEEFRVFYQPKVDISTGELAGAEALCRWFRDGRIMPPMEFIPVLERTSDICKLDFYMLDHVCRDIRRWLDEGKKVVRVSINLSRRHMMDIDLLQNILDIVDRHNVPHRYIEIELTETTTDVEFRDLKRVVGGLQKSGIYTSVDDFGMGYSSLNLIREIPWNVLKVDKSFLPVDEDNSGSNRSIMFKYVLAMAREMGLECIAEGVETKAQVKVLRENKCGFAQGFLFDRPLPVDEFENRLSGSHYDIDV